MFLEKLSNLPGVSGDEGAVREAIIEIVTGSSAAGVADRYHR